jgi:DNA helicase HerA-like ATPase
MSLLDEKLTEQFLRWELCGRGWQLWDVPVSPEPAFCQFNGHRIPAELSFDDGRKPTVLSSLARKVNERVFGARSPELPVKEDDDEPEPVVLFRDDLIELQMVLPGDMGLNREVYGYFLSSLSVCQEPVTFELISDGERITLQFAVHPVDAAIVREQFSMFFPDAAFLPRSNYFRETWDKTDGEEAVVVEMGLKREFMLPLALGKTDPFFALVGALSELRQNEIGVFQVIFESVRHPWSESILRSVTDGAGDEFFIDAPELFAGAKQKITRPLYAAVVRIAAKSGDADRVRAIARNIVGALGAFDNPTGNELIPLRNDGYASIDHTEDLLCRQSHRSGMLLTADELTGFVHIPSADVRSAKLNTRTSKSKAAPAIVIHERGLLLGKNTHLGVEQSVTLEPDQRMRHVHIIGASGTGKTTLLYQCIRQDIENGKGVAVLDPAGDLVDRILGSIPENRIDDVVYIDPSDIEYPVGFNILFAHSELEKTLLASDLVSVFERLSTAWGDQLGSVLRSAILAFLESEKGGSLADLRRFLLEPDFREKFLETVRDPEVVYYWRKGFPALSGNKSIGPVVTRLQNFLTPKSIRYMVSQTANRLDFADILDSGKIFLAKLSQGIIGNENSYLLGSLFVSKLQQLAMARQSQDEAQRRDFYLYIDEFHNFITPSMAEILTGTRKYRLGLVLSHHELHQLEKNRDVASAVQSNSYTRIVFRVSDQDARALENGFSSFDSKDLQNLGTGEAICRVERSDFDFNLKVAPAEYPKETEAAERRRRVIAASRAKYATPRAHIEGAIAPQKMPAPEVPQPPPQISVLPQPPPSVEAKIPITPAAQPSLAEEAATPGRGGREHKNLQGLIKQWAEGMGYRATIEKPVLHGLGSVDVALEKGSQAIACEISITTPAEQELGNVKKCLSAGFHHVFLLCTEEDRVEKMKRAVSKGLTREEIERTRFSTPDGLFAFVQELEAKAVSGERTVKGYKVKVNYRPLDSAEREETEQSIAQALVKSVRRRGVKK